MRKVNIEKSPLNLGTILIRVAIVLLILTMISIYLLGSLFARYVSKGSGGDSARVAAFDVEVSGPDGVEILYAQVNEAYNLTVKNRSEVAVAYNVQVKVDALDFDIKVKLGDTELSPVADTMVDFGQIGSLPPGGEATHPLTFTVLDWNQFTQMVNESSREKTVGFTVYIDVVQVD